MLTNLRNSHNLSISVSINISYAVTDPVMSCISKISTLNLHKEQYVAGSPGKEARFTSVLVKIVLVSEARELKRFHAKIVYMLVVLPCFEVKNDASYNLYP